MGSQNDAAAKPDQKFEVITGSFYSCHVFGNWEKLCGIFWAWAPFTRHEEMHNAARSTVSKIRAD